MHSLTEACSVALESMVQSNCTNVLKTRSFNLILYILGKFYS